jgi:SAM-dependent methyltransferase
MPSTSQFSIGVHGLALLREWLTGDPATVEARLQHIREILQPPEHGEPADWFDAPEMAARTGYNAWSATYDEPGNPIIELEEPLVDALARGLPHGVVLDAACGTGRHTRRLDQLGHRVLAVDTSEQMVQRTRQKLPNIAAILCDLDALPLADASVDAAICALALTHCTELQRPVRELAREVRPGGTVIVSDVHPFTVALGGQALFRGSDGNRAFVRNYVHLYSDYHAAFGAAGLTVEQLFEPTIGQEDAGLPQTAKENSATGAMDVVKAALVGLPGVIVWHLRRT